LSLLRTAAPPLPIFELSHVNRQPFPPSSLFQLLNSELLNFLSGTVPSNSITPAISSSTPRPSCVILPSICSLARRSELQRPRLCRLPRLRRSPLFPLPARGETASKARKSFQTHRQKRNWRWVSSLKPRQRRSSGIQERTNESRTSRSGSSSGK